METRQVRQQSRGSSAGCAVAVARAIAISLLVAVLERRQEGDDIVALGGQQRVLVMRPDLLLDAAEETVLDLLDLRLGQSPCRGRSRRRRRCRR